MKKQRFLKIAKFSAVGIGLAYLILLYVIALIGRDNFFMGDAVVVACDDGIHDNIFVCKRILILSHMDQ
ncbi:MAG: hypothetical protein GKS07_10200 [Nitrosopumilus sp.]|nr:MAG: hypothetical protein GKS07_10200 [Nitrosopumilus sp.]